MSTTQEDDTDELRGGNATTASRVFHPRITRNVLGILIVLHGTMIAYSSFVHSPTLDEPGHLVAGLSHWKYGRHELYRVNPPLIRMWATLPVLFLPHEEDWERYHVFPGSRTEFSLGTSFVQRNNARTFFLLAIARCMCIPFSVLGMMVCYFWARDIHGRGGGLLAATLWAFSPNIVGHASLITTDAHAAALGFVACYCNWRWLGTPSWRITFVNGFLLGTAQLAKSTFVVLAPVWFLIWLIDRLFVARRRKVLWRKEIFMLILQGAVALYVVNAGYGFRGTLEPIGTLSFCSQLLTVSNETMGGTKHPLEQRINRFAESWIGGIPVPIPSDFLLGMDAQQRDFEAVTGRNFLLGQRNDRGWWYFYLIAGLVKIPVGTLLLALWGIWRMAFFHNRTQTGIGSFLSCVLPPISILLLVSMKCGISEHSRYAFPCLPFLFLFAGATCSKFVRRPIGFAVPESFAKGYRFVIWLLAIGSIGSSLWSFPHGISYFNEIVGGPRNGHLVLLGSDVDWGQDLRYAIRWIEEQRAKSTDDMILMAYHGPADPNYYGLKKTYSCCDEVLFPSGLANLSQNSKPCYLILSRTLHDANGFPLLGGGNSCDPKSVDLSIVDSLEEIGSFGYSMVLYQLNGGR